MANNKGSNKNHQNVKTTCQLVALLQPVMCYYLLPAGAQPGLVDFYMWPWFERLPVLQAHGYAGLQSDAFPKLLQWVEDVKAHPTVKLSYIEPEGHIKFYKSYLADIYSIVYDPEE